MFKITLQDTNYRAKIVQLGEAKKHPNADKLQIFTIDFQNIITDLSYKQGDYVVYFPLECAINKELISFFNGFSNAVMNADQVTKSFFDNNGRVRAIRLRQEPSQGFVLKLELLESWLSVKITGFVDWKEYPDTNIEFDSFDDIVICQKYIPATNTPSITQGKQKQSVKGISRLVDGQFRLHGDTENLRKNVHNLKLDDYIGLHVKKHGTSFVVGNVLVNKKLTWIERLLQKLKVNIASKIYDAVYSSRRVVKNEYETANKQGFYKTDIWGIVKDEIKDKIPKGYTLYGEILGFLPDGGAIQGKYDYSCKFGEHKTYIYRITITNEDGFVLELNDLQIKEFCDKYDLLYSDTFFYYGTVENWLIKNCTLPEEYPTPDWQALLITKLEEKYNEKDCYMCINKVAEEGIVLRVNKTFEYVAYKLKSFRFNLQESEVLDKGLTNIEDS